MHPRTMRESLDLLNNPIVRGFFATTRAGAARASEPDVFGMGTVVVFTMQFFTAQSWLAAGEHFSDFNDFDISKR